MIHSSNTSQLLTPVSILVGSLVIAGAIMSTRSPLARVTGVATAPTQEIQSAAPDAAKVSAENVPYIGKKDAPVTIAYWYDYQCPFCKQNEAAAMSSTVQEYVAAGKVRILFKDLQFLGPDSITLGTVGRAVWEVAPSKFYAWHKAIFENQGQENSGWATREKILAITTPVLGPSDTDRVMRLADSKATIYQKAMDADKAEAGSLSIGSTPTSLVGQTVIVGARPYADVKTAIEKVLSGK